MSENLIKMYKQNMYDLTYMYDIYRWSTDIYSRRTDGDRCPYDL